jgi:GNAT superfamily N-acetyltransferase
MSSSETTGQQIFSDLALAQRLERAEGLSNREYVETRVRRQPGCGSCWTEIAGASAMYDGPASPLTQTFGLGMSRAVTADELAALENFFQSRGAPVFHEISPLADAALWPLLCERGYHPFEFTSVMFRPSGDGIALEGQRNEAITVRLAREDEHEMWARTASEGWSEFVEFAGYIYEMSLNCIQMRDTYSFFAELDGRPVATGGLSLRAGVALLAGASTLPAARKQGAQLALLEARLRFAAAQGCDLAMMCALPGSASQRNAERQGFRIAYTRSKWRLN